MKTKVSIGKFKYDIMIIAVAIIILGSLLITACTNNIAHVEDVATHNRMYDAGFRTTQDIEICKKIIDTNKKLDCYGFKEVKV
jgi:hypothetical protein